MLAQARLAGTWQRASCVYMEKTNYRKRNSNYDIDADLEAVLQIATSYVCLA